MRAGFLIPRVAREREEGERKERKKRKKERKERGRTHFCKKNYTKKYKIDQKSLKSALKIPFDRKGSLSRARNDIPMV